MNSGVAKAIRATYPKAFLVYRETFEREGLGLGRTIWVECGRHVVINAITQASYGYDGNLYLSYDALEEAFRQVNSAFQDKTAICPTLVGDLGTAIALPRIGAGLAGGDWERIAAIIEATCTHVQPVVYEL
jgi:O-acetyl-ADP-ribose deacetylase (regulator of RNase III)